ncbi:DUF4113 domain-containing protein [Humidesulfovibrio sp.]
MDHRQLLRLRPWRLRQHRRSPRYTTVWDELPRIGQVKG